MESLPDPGDKEYIITGINSWVVEDTLASSFSPIISSYWRDNSKLNEVITKIVEGYGDCEYIEPSEAINPDSAYQCKSCSTSFADFFSYLRLHTKCSQNHATSHPPSTMLSRSHRCDICNKHFVSKSNLARHVKIHIGEKAYMCEICNNRFTQSNDLKRHLKLHAEGKIFKDKQPANVKNSPQSNNENEVCIENDVDSCKNEESHICHVCSKQFSSKSNLNNHIRIHNIAKPFKCKQCNRRFTQNGDLKRHVMLHNGEKPYACTKCEQCFTQSSDLKRHLIRHLSNSSVELKKDNENLFEPTSENNLQYYSGGKHICPVCSKEFSTNGNLNRHIKIHSGKKPYKCTQCEKGFSQKNDLKRHVRKHLLYKSHSNEFGNSSRMRENSFIRGEYSKDMKQHVCNVCSKHFASKRNLYRHMEIHNRAKVQNGVRYKCKECGWQFNLLSDLEKHMKDHFPEKPIEYEEGEVINEENLQLHVIGGQLEGQQHRIGGQLEVQQHRTGEVRDHPDAIDDLESDNGLEEQPHYNNGVNHDYDDESCTENDQCNSSDGSMRSISDYGVNGDGGSTIDDLSDGNRHQCNLCGKCFSTDGNLSRHLKIHTGEKPYNCDKCHRRFIQKNDLKRHLRVHLHENLNPPKTMKKQNVEKHEKQEKKSRCNYEVRIGDMIKYACKICSKLFSNLSNMYRHMKLHKVAKESEAQNKDQKMKHLKSEKHLTIEKSLAHNDAEYLSMTNIQQPLKSFNDETQFNNEFPNANVKAAQLREYSSEKTVHDDSQFFETLHEGSHFFDMTNEQLSESRKEEGQHKTQVPSGGKEVKQHKTQFVLGGKKRYVCGVCSKHFSTAGNLSRHRKLHLAAKQGAAKQGAPKQDVLQSNHNTDLQEKQLPDQSNIVDIISDKSVFAENSQQPVKPRKKETQISDLVLFMDKKNYVCNVCNKRFANLSNLYRHMKLHKERQVNQIKSIKKKQLSEPSSEKALMPNETENPIIKNPPQSLEVEKKEVNGAGIDILTDLTARSVTKEVIGTPVIFTEKVKEKTAVTSEKEKEETAVTSEEVKEETAVTFEKVKEKTAVTSEKVKEKTAVTCEKVKEKTAVTCDESEYLSIKSINKQSNVNFCEKFSIHPENESSPTINLQKTSKPSKRVSQVSDLGVFMDKKNYVCNVCNKRFANLSNLYRHMKLHKERQVTQNKSLKKKPLNEPLISNENENSLTKNPQEPLILQKKEAQVNGHVNGVKKKKYICNVCFKQFSTSGNLSRHRKLHTGKKESDRFLNLGTHPTIIPVTEEVNRTSAICTENVKEETAVTCDEKVNGMPIISNEEVNETPIYTDRLKEETPVKHDVSQHLNNKSSQQPLELKLNEQGVPKLNEQGTLKLIEQGTPKLNEQGTLKPKKRRMCNVCYKQFSTIGNLARHRKIHTREKTYKCKECSAEFSQNIELKVHMKLHSETLEKPEKPTLQNLPSFLCDYDVGKTRTCDICSKTFSSNSNLLRHLKIHTGEKPYQCNECQRYFTQSNDLKRHIKKHEEKATLT